MICPPLSTPLSKLLRINLGFALFLLVINLAMWFGGIKPPGGDDFYFLGLAILLLLFLAFEIVAAGLCLMRRDYGSLLFALATIVVIVLIPVIFFTVFPPGGHMTTHQAGQSNTSYFHSFHPAMLSGKWGLRHITAQIGDWLALPLLYSFIEDGRCVACHLI